MACARWVALVLCLLAPAAIAQGKTAAPAAGLGLANTTVLIIRHAEKPDSGPGLAPAGEARANAYVRYFTTLVVDGRSARPEYLIASTDSAVSARPRLTLEPLSRALQLPIHQPFADKKYARLAEDLRAHSHGKTLLIAWHHGEIPALLQSLGVDPSAVLPSPKWPEDVFGWLIVLHYNHQGQPRHIELIRERLMPDDR